MCLYQALLTFYGYILSIVAVGKNEASVVGKSVMKAVVLLIGVSVLLLFTICS